MIENMCMAEMCNSTWWLISVVTCLLQKGKQPPLAFEVMELLLPYDRTSETFLRVSLFPGI